MRISRTFRFGRMRVQPFGEIFNVLNLSTVQTQNENVGGVGSLWGQPTDVVDARRLQLGAQLEW
jgi:hypothetical protein